MKKEYKITPKIWGPMAWNFLHNLPNCISGKMKTELKEKYINFIYNYEYFIPCKVCIKHYREFIHYNRINIKKLNKRYLQEYICKMHNNINKLHNKKEYTFKECLKVQKRMNNKIFYTYINIVLLYYKKENISITKLNEIKNLFYYLGYIYPNENRKKTILNETKKESFIDITDINELITWYLELLKKLKFKN